MWLYVSRHNLEEPQASSSSKNYLKEKLGSRNEDVGVWRTYVDRQAGRPPQTLPSSPLLSLTKFTSNYWENNTDLTPPQLDATPQLLCQAKSNHAIGSETRPLLLPLCVCRGWKGSLITGRGEPESSPPILPSLILQNPTPGCFFFFSFSSSPSPPHHATLFRFWSRLFCGSPCGYKRFSYLSSPLGRSKLFH